MTSAVELAQVWVPLMPEASRLAEGVERIGRDVERRFGHATKTLGSQMAGAVDSSGKKVVASLREVEKQTIAVEKAKRAQADAEGRVTVAAKRSEEVYKNARATNAQKAAASEAYARAKRGEMAATDSLTRSEKALTAATKQRDSAQEAAARASKAMGSGGMKLPTGAGLLAQAEQYGNDSGQRFVTGMKRALGATAALAVGGGFVAGVKTIVDAGLDYEKSMNMLSGVTSASGAEMETARKKARDLGADTTIVGASAADAGQAMTELAKGGLTLAQSMTAAKGTLNLAAAAQVSAAEAATIQASALNAFNLQADQAGNVADYLANTANASVGDIGDFALGLQQAGGVAHGFGLSIEDTLSALGMLANAGIKGSDAGTLLKTSLQSITDQGNPAQGAIKELGLTLYDTTGKFVGYRSMLEQVGLARNRMSEQDFQAQTNILFGSDAMRGAMVGNIEDFDKMKAAVTNYGGAVRLAEANMQGLPGVVEKISNTAEGAKLALFDLIDPTLQAGGEKVVGFLQKAADGFDALGKGRDSGPFLTQLAAGWRDISGAAERLAPAATDAAKAIANGVGATAITAWRSLGIAMQIVEPPLRLVANLIGGSQWVTSGIVALLGGIYLKSKLAGPVLSAAAAATQKWGNAFGGWKTSAAEFARAQDAANNAWRVSTDGIGQASNLQRGYITRLRDAYQTASGEAGRFHRSAGMASSAMAGLKMAGGGVMSMLGGPWSVISMGLIGAVGAIADSHAKAAEKAREQKAAEDALAQTLSAGQLTQQSREQVAKGLQESGATSRAESYGIDPNDLLRAAAGDQKMLETLRAKARDEILKGLASYSENRNGQQQSGTDIMGQYAKAGVDSQTFTNAMMGNKAAIDRVNAALQRSPEAMSGQLTSIDKLLDRMPDVNESFVTMMRSVEQQTGTVQNSIKAWEEQNRTQFGTWEATQRGVEAFKALGATILSTPNEKQVRVEVAPDQLAVFNAKMAEIGNTTENLPDGTVVVTANTDEAQARWREYLDKVNNTQAGMDVVVTFRDRNGSPISPESLRTPGFAPAVPGETARPRGGGRATGGRIDRSGRITGPGSGTSDSILARVLGGNLGYVAVSNQESVNTAASTRANWPVIDAMNKGANLNRWFKSLPSYADGGLIDYAESLVGHEYSQGTRWDCSGTAARLVNKATGYSGDDGLMTTKNAASWLAARGFQEGMGGPDDMSVGWYDNGGGPNSGHMAVTLPGGINAEQGGKNGVFTLGAGASGADDPQFTNQMFLPAEAMYPEGGGYGGGFGGGSGGGFGGAGGGGGSSSGGSGPTRAEQRALRNAEQKVDDKKLAVQRAQQAVDEAKTDKERTAATDRLTKANREATDAEDDLASKREEINEKVADRASKSTGTSSKSGSDGGAKSFGSSLLSGALEAIGLDGSVFENPMEWGIWKLFTGGANYVGGILKNWGQDQNVDGSGNPLGATAYRGDPNSTQHGRGSGSPGPRNYGAGSSDGGFGALGLGLLDSVLPQASDWIANSQGGGNTTTTTTNNQNSGNTSSANNFYGPVTMTDPAAAPKPPDRAATRQTGLPG